MFSLLAHWSLNKYIDIDLRIIKMILNIIGMLKTNGF